LQTGGEVRRLADDRLLLAGPSPIRSPTTTNPVAIATRACSLTDLTLRRPAASMQARPARTARSASSSRARGTPKAAIAASPMNFSITPP